MKKLHFISILLFLPFFINAQHETKATHDALKNVSLDSIEKLYTSYKYKKPTLAKTYALAYYKRVIKEKSIQAINKATYMSAEIYNIIGKKDSAHYFVDQSIAKSKTVNDQEHYINSLHLKGKIYYHSNEYDEAISMYTKVYGLIKEDNVIELSAVANSIALIKNQIGHRKQALELIKKNIDFYDRGILDKDVYPTKYLNTLLNISNIYTNMAEDFSKYKVQYLDSAEVHNLKGLSLSHKLKDLDIHSMFLTLQAIILQKKGDYKEALVNFKKAKKLIKELKLTYQLSVLHMYEGKNYFLQNDIENALTYLVKADSIITKSNIDSPFIHEVYILLVKCYEKKNDIKNTLKYYEILQKKHATSDIFIRTASEKLYKQYDVPSFKNKIKLLIKKSKEEEQKSKTLQYVCIFLLIISIFGFWYYKQRERKHKKRFHTVLEELKEAETLKNKAPEKVSHSYNITDENVIKILEGLENFENKLLFLQKKCSLNYVAKKVNTNITYLSKTLQSHKQKKFIQYITDLRINYALTQLKSDSKFRAYDIKSIASELGFKTSESFSRAFKERTGFYPSFYIKNLNKLSKMDNES